MTDSTPQYQRATAADADWLQEYFEDDEWSPEAQERIRRILDSLRATPSVPDREALARALYVIDGHGDDERQRQGEWGAPYSETRRIYYGEQADRLARVLGGFPALTAPEDSLRRLLMNAIDHFCQTEGFPADAEHVAAAADMWANQFAEHHPAAVLEQEPRAWEVRGDGHHVVAFNETAAKQYGAEGYTVTPLFAATPQVETQTT